MQRNRSHLPDPDDLPPTVDETVTQDVSSPVSPYTIKFDCPVCEGKLETEASTRAIEFACPHCGALIMTPVMGIGAGTVLDDFRLIRSVGRGAMGEVFQAMQRSLSRMVALKILAPAMTSSPEQVVRFRREIQNLARLYHPNIVTAFYAGTHQDIHYLAMSYVDGESVHARIHHQGPLDEEEALSVIYKVASALRYAWEEFGFIHRDIKPANIMIDADGEVKLTDLGISKFVYEETSATHGHRIFGTPHYMSPEQARGELDLDFRTDMYSLGVTFYHMLSGRPPFEDTDIQDILRRQIREQPRPIREMRPDVTPGSEMLLRRMLAKNPNDRFDSWDALMHAITDVLEQLPHHTPRNARPGTETQEVWLDQRTRRAIGRWVALAVVALSAAAVWFAWDVFRSPPEEPVLPDFAQRALERARTSPEHLNAAIERLSEGAQRAVDATESARLNWSLQRLERERRLRVQEVLDHLDQRALVLLREGKPDHAVSVYLDYDGPWAVESRDARLERADAYQRPLPPSPFPSNPADASDSLDDVDIVGPFDSIDRL